MKANQETSVVVGLGEILWDMLPDGRQLGGAPANFAYHAQVLGANATIVSCVGDDDLGRDIRDRLQEFGLDTAHVFMDQPHPTVPVSVKLDPQGKPDYVIHENVAWDFIPWDVSLEELAARTGAVCFGSLCQRSPVSRRTVMRFLEATRPDCMRICDVNLRQSYYSPGVLHEMLSHSTILKLNDQELPVLAELMNVCGDGEGVLRDLQKRYDLSLIVLTMGADGSRLFSPDRVFCHRLREPVAIADTVGAGDAFTAAVAVGLMAGWELDQIGEAANRLAVYVCTQQGAMPAIPQAVLPDTSV